MGVARRFIDLEEQPELARLVDAVSGTHEPIVLRRHGKDLAVVVPLDDASAFAPGRDKTASDHEAFLRSAGGWQGIVDQDDMEEIYRSRSVSGRSSVDL
jgi:prevent-host-death family protein